MWLTGICFELTDVSGIEIVYSEDCQIVNGDVIYSIGTVATFQCTVAGTEPVNGIASATCEQMDSSTTPAWSAVPSTCQG